MTHAFHDVRRNPRLLIAVVGVLLLIVAAVVAIATRGGADPNPTASASCSQPTATATDADGVHFSAGCTFVVPQSTVTVTASPSPSATPTVTPTPTITPPTVTPSPTPTVIPSSFPDGTNTGIPAGTVLTAYTGPKTITTNGTVIDGKTLTGDIRIKAAGVVVKNSQVNGDVRIDSDDASQPYSFTIQDSAVNAGRAGGQDSYDGTGIGAVNFTALRVNVIAGKLSINCFLRCSVQDSYLHGQVKDPAAVQHSGAIRIGDTSTVVHNTLACEMPENGNAGCSGDLTGYGDFGPIQNDLIQGNYMVAQATGGGVCAYGGSSAGKPYSAAANHVRFINNVFGRTVKNDHGKLDCAYYFAVTDFDSSAPGNVFTGNVYTDGTPVSSG